MDCGYNKNLMNYWMQQSLILLRSNVINILLRSDSGTDRIRSHPHKNKNIWHSNTLYLNYRTKRTALDPLEKTRRWEAHQTANCLLSVLVVWPETPKLNAMSLFK